MKEICSIENCTGLVAARGRCWKHYKRNLRVGDKKYKDGCLICGEVNKRKGLCKYHLIRFLTWSLNQNEQLSAFIQNRKTVSKFIKKLKH